MSDLARLEKSFNRVKGMTPSIEVMLEKAGDNALCEGSNVTLNDLIRAYSELIDSMSEVIAERKMSPDLHAALVKAMQDAVKDAKDATTLPEGAVLIQATSVSDDLSEATVLVLEKVGKGLLKEIVKNVIGCLAGGTDDVLSQAEAIAPAKRTETYGEVVGFAGAPYLGKVVVTRVEDKVRKAAGRPTEPEPETTNVFTYLLAAASKKLDRSVNLR